MLPDKLLKETLLHCTIGGRTNQNKLKQGGSVCRSTSCKNQVWSELRTSSRSSLWQLTMTMNQVASPLRLCKHQINLLATLSPLTLSSSINIFFAYRILQTRTMFLYVLHSPNFHSKLGALLQGATCTRHLYGTTTASHQQLVLQVLLWTLCCVCQIFLYPKTPTSSLHWFYLWTYYGKRTFPLSKIQARP